MSHILFRVHGRERDVAAGIWRDALAAPFTDAPRWFHGDVSLANLLVREGALGAVIDFGCSAAGDPACDTVFRWTSRSDAARRRFALDYPADDAMWARGRGWALWKGLIMITNKPPRPGGVRPSRARPRPRGRMRPGCGLSVQQLSLRRGPGTAVPRNHEADRRLGRRRD